MTIKEMELRSGMTRANIRFYESEGLLQPVRTENGYRDYSEEDLTALKRIRLLRMLGVPLEEIKRVQGGREELSSVLKSRQEELEKEQLQTEICRRVCREMQEDQVRYDTLNAQKYLDSMSGSGAVPVPASDQVVQPWVPWRRFFARVFDALLYETFWIVLLCAGFHVRYSGVLFGWLSFFTLLLIEPLFLSKLGTTPGKWIFGMTVTNEIGGRLSYQAAFLRLWRVLWWGYGLGIPIFHVIRLAISYNTYLAGNELPWEYESELLIKDRSNRRVAVMIAAQLALLTVIFLSLFLALWPRHWGKLTVPQFCDNYNGYAAYYYTKTGKSTYHFRLDSAGNWERNGMYDMDADSPAGPPPLHFETDEDGCITSVSFERKREISVEKEDRDWLWSVWEISDSYELRDLTQMIVLSYGAPRGTVLFRLDQELSIFDFFLSDDLLESGGSRTHAELFHTEVEVEVLASNFVKNTEADFGYTSMPGEKASLGAKVVITKRE